MSLFPLWMDVCVSFAPEIRKIIQREGKVIKLIAWPEWLLCRAGKSRRKNGVSFLGNACLTEGLCWHKFSEPMGILIRGVRSEQLSKGVDQGKGPRRGSGAVLGRVAPTVSTAGGGCNRWPGMLVMGPHSHFLLDCKPQICAHRTTEASTDLRLV